MDRVSHRHERQLRNRSMHTAACQCVKDHKNTPWGPIPLELTLKSQSDQVWHSSHPQQWPYLWPLAVAYAAYWWSPALEDRNNSTDHVSMRKRPWQTASSMAILQTYKFQKHARVSNSLPPEGERCRISTMTSPDYPRDTTYMSHILPCLSHVPHLYGCTHAYINLRLMVMISCLGYHS